MEDSLLSEGGAVCKDCPIFRELPVSGKLEALES
jgi:hypothetical protein